VQYASTALAYNAAGMSGGGISTISMSLGVMPSCASIFRRNRKSTANRLGTAILFPLNCRKRW